MKHIVITEREVCDYPELVELFELKEQDIEDCTVPDLFSMDPDYFSWGIKNHLHKISFVEILDKYIIVPDDDVINAISDYKIEKISDKCKEMLIRFFDFKPSQYFISVEDTWKSFNGLSFGIAYRGGMGYSYSIWRYWHKEVK